jgi:TPR repeat protein
MRSAFIGRCLSLFRRPALNAAAQGGIGNLGEAEAQFRLGARYAEGTAVGRDEARAADWFEKAASQGHCEAQFHLGLLHGRNAGTLRDEGKALVWLRKAADQGHAGAQYHLGVRHHRASRSGRQDEASECRIEAFKWLALAVGQSYEDAQLAWDSVALIMTWEEVAEGGRRASVCAAARSKPAG